MKRIAYVGGHIPPKNNCVWGGTMATNNAYLKAFENDPEWKLDILTREKSITSADNIRRFCQGADIVHLDDTGVCEVMYSAGMKAPDVIGPITRSPIKNYKGWECPYPKEWFYKANVIRLNYQEERKAHHLVTLIVHGVDTERLIPSFDTSRTNILWAGQATRYAKNYQMWLDIQDKSPPTGYCYKTMSAYAVRDYWNALASTAVVVCTSRSESFCCAAFEAMSKGVPVVWRDKLQGDGVWEDAGIRCEYTPDGFHEGIHRAITLDSQGLKDTRKYVVDHCSLKHMRDSYAKVFQKVVNERQAP